MKQEDIIRRFKLTFNNQPNIMTPNITKYGQKGQYLYEISFGAGIEYGTRIWGVTVITKAGERTDLGKCFATEDEAEGYARHLSQEATA